MSDSKFNIVGKPKTMSVYEDKVVLSGNKGVGLALMGASQGEKSFAYESISSIEFQEATLLKIGQLTFVISGDKGQSDRIFGKLAPDWANSNTFAYDKRGLNDEVRAAKNYIEERMIQTKKLSQSVVQQVSPADELRKYKQLLDEGIITQDEFNEKKKQLL